MDKKEFFEIAGRFAKARDWTAERYFDEETRMAERYGRAAAVPKVNECFAVSWETGGMSGGSCWGTEPRGFVSDEKEPDFEAFYEMLETHFPSIPFLVARKFDKKVSYGDYCDREYYGNHTNYRVKILRFEDIYDILAEAGFVD